MAHLKLNTKRWLQLGKKLGYIKKAQEESKEDLMDRLMAEQMGVDTEAVSGSRRLREEGLNEEAIAGYEWVLKDVKISPDQAREVAIAMYEKDKDQTSKWDIHRAARDIETGGLTVRQAVLWSSGSSHHALGTDKGIQFRLMRMDKDLTPSDTYKMVNVLPSDLDDRDQVLSIMGQHGLDIKDSMKLQHAMKMKKMRDYREQKKS
jgi:hypothetical protein